MNRVLVSGPIFDTPSGPSGQGGKLYTKLREENYQVYRKSKYRNKILRVLDTLFFVILNARKYDIILIQMFSNMAFIIDFLQVNIANLLGKKTILIIRGGAFVEFYNRYPKWVGGVLKKAGKITSPSYFIGNYLKSKGHSVIYVPNFIETNKFPFKWTCDETNNLLWVRAFHDIYKPELAIKTIANLKVEFPSIKLTMVGPDQGKLAHCKQLIDSLGLNENIKITGPISNDELSSYYSSHKVYLNTTSYESFGVALIEAACSGIPIVSTDVGEIPFMWNNNEDMLIVEDKNEAEFILKVKLLLKDETLQLKLSKNARVKAEKYSWDNIKQQWFEILK